MRVCALKYSNVIEYTIPSFSVIKVKLRQAVIQTIDTSGEPAVLDVFFREDSSLNTKLPQELIVDEACIVDVSGLHVLSVNRMYSCIIYYIIGGRVFKGSARFRDNGTGVFVIWTWKWVHSGYSDCH